MDKTIINDAIEFVRNTFKGDYSGHDYFHTLRVYKMAMRIAEHENADLIIVQLAALLHDVDDFKLSPETYENKDRVVVLFQLRGLMNTATAKKIAKQREGYMKSYISEFLDEWDGIR